jgi:hypothetical protein
MKKLTWEQLIAIEPRLLDMYLEAQAVEDNGKRFCANQVWLNWFKPRLLWLVGWQCSKAEISTSEAWDLACRKIYNALPDCRDCYCM